LKVIFGGLVSSKDTVGGRVCSKSAVAGPDTVHVVGHHYGTRRRHGNDCYGDEDDDDDVE